MIQHPTFSMKDRNYTVGGRIWVESGGETHMAAGRVELLSRFETYGSLRKAALSMGLSYRKAFYTIRQMNQISEAPLVLFKRGGIGGGCATLTETGRSIVLQYQKLSQTFVTFLTKQSLLFR